MRVVDLRPGMVPAPQCSMTIERMTSPVSQFYSDYRKKKASKTGRDFTRCQKSSKYIIDGEYYCAGHGGLKAIEILREQGQWP